MAGYGYTNQINDFDYYTENAETINSALLQRAINDAATAYKHGNISYEKYEQVCRMCNEVLEMRGNTPTKPISRR